MDTAVPWTSMTDFLGLLMDFYRSDLVRSVDCPSIVLLVRDNARFTRECGENVIFQRHLREGTRISWASARMAYAFHYGRFNHVHQRRSAVQTLHDFCVPLRQKK